MTNELTSAAIQQKIAKRQNVKVITVEQTESTQLLAKDYLAHHDCDKPVAFIANQQTGGYGQHGRQFYSPAESGLYLSLLVPGQNIRRLGKSGLLTTSVAVVVARLLEQYFPSPRLSLKWVNDVYLGQKKVAGILTEAVLQLGNTSAALIIGIGINLTTQSFPQKLVGKATSLGDFVDRNQLTADLLVNLIGMLDNYSSGHYLDEYRQRCFLLGSPVTVRTGHEMVRGVAKTISKNGSLIVIDSDGEQRIIRSGEVEKVDY